MRVAPFGLRLPRIVSGRRWSRAVQENRRMESVLANVSAILHGNPEILLQRAFQEMDSTTLQWIMDMAGWESLAGRTADYLTSEPRRALAVQGSRALVWSDNNASATIKTWTDYGFGRSVSVYPKAETDVPSWQKFWTAPYNRHVLGDREIHKLSDGTLVDGETFLAFFASRATGRTRVRRVDTGEIVDYKTNPQDKYEVAWWKRAWVDEQGTSHELWYPDRFADQRLVARVKSLLGPGASFASELAREEQQRLMAEQNGPVGAVPSDVATSIVLMHISREERGGVRGWPHLAVAKDSVEEYRSWLHARQAVAQAVYMYTDKIRGNIGTRGISMIQQGIASSLQRGTSPYLDTNPPAAPGSVWIENERFNRERMPLGTGGVDAARDNSAFLGYLSAGAGVTPMHLGQGELVRMAVAEMMMQPILRQWMRYQVFWRSVWEDVADYVLTVAGSPTDHAVDVAMDTLVDATLAGVADALTALADATVKGIVPQDKAVAAALRMVGVMLEKLGFDDPEKILGDLESAAEPTSAPAQAPPTEGLSWVRAIERIMAREVVG